MAKKPTPVVDTVLDRLMTRHEELEKALEPYEADRDVRTHVVDQLLAAEYWSGDGVPIRVPSSLIVKLLEAVGATGYSDMRAKFLAAAKDVGEKFSEIDRLQARIDALMYEYCPDEMTPEQVEAWGTHQAAGE